MRGQRLRLGGQRNRVGDDDLVDARTPRSARPRRRTAPGACSRRRPCCAPCSLSAVAALHSVFAVSTMSSMITQVRPSTSPMMFITSETLAFGRRLSMIARSESRRLAIARARTTPPTSGRDDEQVVVVLLPQVAEQDRRRVDVVDRDVEEALDLVGVQVHHHHAVDADGRQHVGDDLGGDRHARRARAAVLPRIAEVGDRGGDARRPTRASARRPSPALPSGCRWSARRSTAA